MAHKVYKNAFGTSLCISTDYDTVYDLSKNRDELKAISEKLHLLKEESKGEYIAVVEENFSTKQDCENPEGEIDHIEDQFDKALDVIERISRDYTKAVETFEKLMEPKDSTRFFVEREHTNKTP